MRRVGSWGGTAVLVVGLGAAIAMAGGPDNDGKPAHTGLLAGLFGDKPKSKAKTEKAAAAEDKPAPPTTVEMAVSEQQRQMNAILRRMEVCDRLRTIAFQSGNEELMRQADELEARAREIYNRQTARLPIPNQAPESPAPAADKKPVTRETSRAGGTPSKELDEAPPTLPQRPPAALERLGGNFEQREQSILNGMSMGRDKP